MANQMQTMPDDLRSSIQKMSGQFKLALPKHMSTDRFTRILFTAVQRNQVLLQCDRSSIYAAMMRAAEQGLLPDGRQGALVPYRVKGVMQAQFIPMWQGLLDLARQSGSIADAYPASVRANDEFDYELGLERKLSHKPALRDRGEIIFVYAVIILTDGTKTFGPGPMTVDEVEEIRARSKSKDNGPWVTDWEAMAWKTVLKRVLKYVPQSPELQQAIEQDNEAGFGDWSAEHKNVTPTEKRTDNRTTTGDGVEDVRRKIEEAKHRSAKEREESDAAHPEWPKDMGDGVLVASNGAPWIADVHSAGKTCSSDGTWRKKKGVSPIAVELAEQEAIEARPTDQKFSHEDLLRMIREAKTKEALDEIEDMSRELPAGMESGMVLKALKAKKQELSGESDQTIPWDE